MDVDDFWLDTDVLLFFNNFECSAVIQVFTQMSVLELVFISSILTSLEFNFRFTNLFSEVTHTIVTMKD